MISKSISGRAYEISVSVGPLGEVEDLVEPDSYDAAAERVGNNKLVRISRGSYTLLRV